MRELALNATEWESTDDLFLSFFRVVGAPEWHGKNFNALRDSIGAGSINRIEVPYRIIIENYNCAHSIVKADLDHFIEVIRQLASEGVPVEVRVDR